MKNQYVYTWGFTPNPIDFFVLTPKSHQKKSRLSKPLLFDLVFILYNRKINQMKLGIILHKVNYV